MKYLVAVGKTFPSNRSKLFLLATAVPQSSRSAIAFCQYRPYYSHPSYSSSSSYSLVSSSKRRIPPSSLLSFRSSSRRSMLASAPTPPSGRDILSSFCEHKKNNNKDDDSSSADDINQQFIGTNVEYAMEMLATAEAVCLDVDSTVIQEEGIDVLGAHLRKGPEIEALTRQAMEGSQKFQDALHARLDLLKPSRRDIEECLAGSPLVLTPGVESFIESLILNHVDVYLVSGGFRIMIEPLARQLCIAKDHIYANTIVFDDNDHDGTYLGFDPTEPTSADMGKRRALEDIQARGGYKTMIMIGDGATDAQAKPPANAFIGFGGVVTRQTVKDSACWFVDNFDDLEWIVQTYGKKHRLS